MICIIHDFAKVRGRHFRSGRKAVRLPASSATRQTNGGKDQCDWQERLAGCVIVFANRFGVIGD
jgi:hypothetical protein